MTDTTTQLANKLGATQQQQVAVRSENPITQVLMSDSFKKQMAMALPKVMTPDRMLRVILTECRKTPELLQCSRESFLGAVMQLSQLGLEPGQALGNAYLIPYGKVCTPIIGYRGMIALARRSGQIKSIHAFAAYEKDDFTYQLGLDPTVRHIPSPEADRGALTHVYAVAHLADGGVQFECMSAKEVEQIRQRSKAGRSGPWCTDYAEMAKKTVVRRLFKYLPISIELAEALERDARADDGGSINFSDVVDSDFEVVG